MLGARVRQRLSCWTVGTGVARAQAGRRAVIKSSSNRWQSGPRPSRHAAKAVCMQHCALDVRPHLTGRDAVPLRAADGGC